MLGIMLVVSALCVFTCLAQAAAGPDPHAACHEEQNQHSAAVVQSHLPDGVATAAPALPSLTGAPLPGFTAVPAPPLEILSVSRRPLPPLILRI
jgi:hypothetical protein